MKIGIIISTNEPEEVWNAFRFGVTALNGGHRVKVFLINSGAEAESIKDEKYDVGGQIKLFLESDGCILACGTCLKARQKEGTAACPISTMKDLLTLAEESDKIVTFG